MRIRHAALSALAITFCAHAQPSRSATIVEPPVYTSSFGVLDIMMVAEAKPVSSFNLSGPVPTGWVYTVCPRPAAGTSCPAGAATTSNYGGFRLALSPGDTLKIRFVNKLPAVSPNLLDRIGDDPLLKLNPSNLHTHGLVVTAAANKVVPPATPVYGDFIFTSIFNPANGDPAKVDPTTYNVLHAHGDVVSTGVVDYNIKLPLNHPQGAFWIHPHMHGIALNQLSAGLSGIISVGKVAAYGCADEFCIWPIPESAVRHLIVKDMQVLGDHTGNFQEDPAFCGVQTPGAPNGKGVCAADQTAYPGGNWFFTLNGQQYPSIPVARSDGEIWRLTNASGSASYNLQLLNDKTKTPMAFQVVSIDGVAVSYPTGATAGQVVTVGNMRMKLAKCGSSTPLNPLAAILGGLLQTYSSAPVCATEMVMMPATRAEIHVAYRDANNALTGAPSGATATFRSTGLNTGPGGDSWPAVDLASVTFPTGRPLLISEAVHVKAADAASTYAPGGVFNQYSVVTDAVRAPLPNGCKALAAGHRRRVYFGNPNVPGGAGPGQDAKGNPIFGLGYEEIDQFGNPVAGTFVDVAQFDPAQTICLPLGPMQRPVTETWELVNLTTELHNFHIHQTKFRKIDPTVTATTTSNPLGVFARQPGIEEDTVPLPYATPRAGSQPALNPDAVSCTVADYKGGRCGATPIVVQIPFAKLGSFVYHCHILEHEDGGMMHAIRVVPSPI